MNLKLCVLCNGDLLPKIVDKEFIQDGQKILVNNIPVLECKNCKEQYLNKETSKYIDEIIKEQKEYELDVRIKEVRVGKGLTQKDVAQKLGFTVARFSDIERNNKVPSILLALKIANALECNINELYSLKIIK